MSEAESGTPEAILSADEFARQLFLYGNQMCLGDAAGTTAACDVLTRHDAAQRKALEYETLSATHHMNRAGFDADEIEALRAEVVRLTEETERLQRTNGALVSGRPEADDPGACPGCGRDWGEPSKLESRLPFPSFEAEDWHAVIAERNAAESEVARLREALQALTDAGEWVGPYITDTPHGYDTDFVLALAAARALLAVSDTPPNPEENEARAAIREARGGPAPAPLWGSPPAVSPKVCPRCGETQRDNRAHDRNRCEDPFHSGGVS